MTVVDPLEPLLPVVIGAITIVVDEHRPVAALVTDDDTRFATWPDAPLPEHAPSTEVIAAPDGVWVVYEESEDGEIPDSGAGTRTGPTWTAVHVGADGRTSSVDLGPRRPSSADAAGLWTVDPRGPSLWIGSEDDEQPDDATSFPDVEDLPLEAPPSDDQDDEAFWPDAGAWGDADGWTEEDGTWLDEDEDENEDHPENHAEGDHAAAESEAAGPSVVATAAMFAAATGNDADDEGPGSGWYIRFPGDDEDERPLGPAPTPLPTPPTEIVHVGMDGARRTIVVDHLVDAVERVGDVLRLRVHAAGPRHVPAHRSWDIRYEPRTVEVDVRQGLPDRIVTDSLPTVEGRSAADGERWDDADDASDDDPSDDDRSDGDPSDEGADWGERWERHLDDREATVHPWRDRIELDGVAGTRWHLAERSHEQIVADVEAVRSQFTGLSSDTVMWTAEDDAMHRVPSDYRNVEVVVEGAWPRDVVVATFEHRRYPYVRFRRRVPVHDASGRPIVRLYLSVHLDEMLDTGQVPPRSEAVDGVLDLDFAS
ncbi:hypothetical protein [Curtobacterium sp. MCBD17_028]|uniref:hypothetical protein n=1 Tax=Curtobacterium sp. MCBD17_028 TaxID=2175670 RepID=UPI000DAAACBD|nr:hypothetical protein [Curtobacterium sp. MCBD17_028]PZE30084.1 hypothetical protein DEI86_02130 [Curtobacterium sp. MCBD17_028]